MTTQPVSDRAVRATFVSLLLAGTALSAQTQPVDLRESREVQAIAQESPAGPVTQPTTAPATQPTTQPSARLTKLKAKFARSPASILKALAAAPDPKADEAAMFQADLVAGRWDLVAKTIASFPPDEAMQLYRHVVAELLAGGQPQQQPGQPQVPPEMEARMAARGSAPGGGGAGAFVTTDDVLALIESAPAEIPDDLIEPIGQLLGRGIARSNVVEPAIVRFEKGIGSIGGTDPKSRERAAAILVAAGRPMEAGSFLPALNADPATDPVKLVDLHSRHLLAASSREDDNQAATLARAWLVTNALLHHPSAAQKDRDAALARAIELLPRLPQQTANQWIVESFSAHPEQGMAVLANAGSTIAQGFTGRDIQKRARDLAQQRTLVDQLIAQGGDMNRWAPALNALAALWIQEVEYSRPRLAQLKALQQQQLQMQMRGIYQNQMQMNPNEPPALDADKLLEAAPSEAWLACIEVSTRASVRAGVANLQLSKDESLAAFPQIEALAASHAKLAGDLSAELLRTMARSWDQIQNMSRQMSYMQSQYGYVTQVQSQPLTRSAQVRNLADLSSILQRLRKLPIDQPDPSTVVAAFVAAHSQAEVFRIEDIEALFGPADQIDLASFFQLTQAMRARLATSWRSAAVQLQAQTRRTDKEADAEVTRGYELIVNALEARLKNKADWKLETVLASALFDWAEFDYGKGIELAVYTARRDRAFALFAQAALDYQDALPRIKRGEQSPLVHMQWFNSALGASDLSALTRQAQPSPTQIQQVRTALLAIPEDARERHIASFGKFLSDSITQLKPELKHRFLTAGVQVIGDHPSANDARKMVRYYEDLLGEIELHAQVDGDAAIGHSKPFGMHLMLRHTQTLGRESGGFGKYLMNQQANRNYYSMTGQTPVNYRDDFEKKIRESLAERFEVMSVTWHDMNVQSTSFGKPGWRQTPLAYVLLKPKDASVDKIPPLQLDLDMPDRTGTVILPVTSQVILVDARPENPAPRPRSNVEITQILDHRDAANGKLVLDIKATARGLLPDLPELLDLMVPGFTIDKTADQGLAINKIDTEGEAPTPISERSWLINLSIDKTTSGVPVFRFPRARDDGSKLTYKQYSDADVTDVERDVALAGLALNVSSSSMKPWLGAGAAIAVALGLAVVVMKRRLTPAKAEARSYQIPSKLTPFTVLELLQRIERDSRLELSTESREQLSRELGELQERYFAPHSNGQTAPELSAIVARWVRHAEQHH